jgi:hypothetical protein
MYKAQVGKKAVLTSQVSNILLKEVWCWKKRCILSQYNDTRRLLSSGMITASVVCSLCRLIRCPEHLISKHCYLPANWRSFIRWSPDQWVSQCYAIECYRSFYCVLFCLYDSCESVSSQLFATGPEEYLLR